MSIKKVVLFSGLALIPVSAFAYYKYAENNLLINLTSLKVNSFTGGVLTLTLEFVIVNKTGLGFTVSGADYNIFLNSSFLGIAQLVYPVKVPSNGVMKMNIESKFNSSQLGDVAWGYLGNLFGKKSEMVFRIMGKSRVHMNAALLKPFLVNIPMDEIYNM